MSDKREQAIKDVAKAADNSPSYIRLCLRDVEMPCDDSLIFQFAVTQREAVLELKEALRQYRLKVHNIEQHNQWFERCESEWCHPIPGQEYPHIHQQGDRAALERSKP